MDIKSLLFSFNGRIGRGPYWAVMVALIVIEIIISAVAPALSNGNGALAIISLLVVAVVALACIWIVFAVQVKRWHDRNKSGWWALIGFVPFIGGIWVLVECGCLPGVNEGNRFGA
jgi:uncharacterized membrane protein YhaH (DUF805 family)